MGGVAEEIVRGMEKAEVPPSERFRLVERASAVTKLRDSHHLIAQMIAAGIPEREVCRACGTTSERLDKLRCSPAFQELIKSYQRVAEPKMQAAMDTFVHFKTKNMIMSEAMQSELLEEALETGEYPKLRDLLAISDSAADRFGYSKHSVSIHANAADFASALERAAGRSAKVIEAKVQEPAPGTAPGEGEPSAEPVPAPPTIQRERPPFPAAGPPPSQPPSEAAGPTPTPLGAGGRLSAEPEPFRRRF